jgi:hypothetical protein
MMNSAMFAPAMAPEQKKTTVSAQEKWAGADHNVRGQMLDVIGYSRYYVATSWKRLPGMIRTNLSNKTWTA